MPRKAVEKPKTKPADKTKNKAQRNSSSQKGQLKDSDLQNISGGRASFTFTRSSAQAVSEVLDSELKATGKK